MSIKVYIPEKTLWDPVKEEFINIKEQTIVLEHSLLSVDKWESKWRKPFLTPDKKTPEEMTDYLRCMTITKDVNPYAYYAITSEEAKRIEAYIQDPMTATTFTDHREGKSNKREIITSEIIYWQMTQLQIPMEWERRHLNKLMTLIKVASIKSEPPKKMSPEAITRQNKALNAARRKRFHSRG